MKLNFDFRAKRAKRAKLISRGLRIIILLQYIVFPTLTHVFERIFLTGGMFVNLPLNKVPVFSLWKYTLQ